MPPCFDNQMIVDNGVFEFSHDHATVGELMSYSFTTSQENDDLQPEGQ